MMAGEIKKTFRVTVHENRYRLVEDRGDIVEETAGFLSALETRGLSSLTVRAYAYDLLALYRWLCTRGEKQARCVEQLKQRDLLDFVRVQRENDASPTSINRRLVVAGLLYRFLTGVHIAAGDKAERGVNLAAPHYKGRGKDRNLGLFQIPNSRYRSLRVKTPRKVVEPLSAEQVRMLIGSFRKYRDIAIVYLMLLCGLRSAEALAVQINDVNFTERRLRVMGKGNNERILPLPKLLLRCLRDYLRFERPSYCPTRALFVVLKGKRRGRVMTTGGLRSLFRYRRRNPSIATANPHRLRHTFGSDMARAGVRLPTLQKMMGHADSKMTLQYINLSMADIAAEFQRAAAQIQKRYSP